MNKRNIGTYKETMKKCSICGLLKPIQKLIKCSICKNDICLFCIETDKCICVNCQTDNYTEKYSEKINAYVE